MIFGNASKKPHDELFKSAELDVVNPVEFGRDTSRLFDKLENFHIVGGCCGTDETHAEQCIMQYLANKAKRRTLSHVPSPTRS